MRHRKDIHVCCCQGMMVCQILAIQYGSAYVGADSPTLGGTRSHHRVTVISILLTSTLYLIIIWWNSGANVMATNECDTPYDSWSLKSLKSIMVTSMCLGLALVHRQSIFVHIQFGLQNKVQMKPYKAIVLIMLGLWLTVQCPNHQWSKMCCIWGGKP